MLASFLEDWRKETPYAKESDWVFASQKTHGKTPRFGGMLVRDYLYPAAEKAGIFFRQRNGSYVDSIGRGVTRFGFHNLRKAVSDYLNEGKKAGNQNLTLMLQRLLSRVFSRRARRKYKGIMGETTIRHTW